MPKRKVCEASKSHIVLCKQLSNYKQLKPLNYLVPQKISLEMIEVVLVQCNLLDNQYDQKSGVLGPLNLKFIC